MFERFLLEKLEWKERLSSFDSDGDGVGVDKYDVRLPRPELLLFFRLHKIYKQRRKSRHGIKIPVAIKVIKNENVNWNFFVVFKTVVWIVFRFFCIVDAEGV